MRTEEPEQRNEALVPFLLHQQLAVGLRPQNLGEQVFEVRVLDPPRLAALVAGRPQPRNKIDEAAPRAGTREPGSRG